MQHSLLFLRREILMDKLIRLDDGKLVKLADYQQQNNLFSNQVSAHFSVTELDCAGEIEVAEMVLKVLEAFRKKKGAAVKINSGYRSPKKQIELRHTKGFAAASVSPHCFGMAADVDAKDREEVYETAKLLRLVASELGIKIRIGYVQYLNLGQTFVHFDVCPNFYAKGKPLYKEPHPVAWENQIEW
jgi:uncharacterized protein YcbK (DUF882 family)